MRVSGPGVSIVSAAVPAAASSAAEAGPRAVDPIICDGERVMQVNNRRVVVTGDAITARNGCQLHIINSRITGTETGVVIRDATVHITNSTIEGGTVSFDAGARFECTQAIPARVSPKDVRNACTFFAPRVSIERETGSTPATGSSSARKAFDDLFKL